MFKFDQVIITGLNVFAFFLIFILIVSGILLAIVTDDDITNLRKPMLQRYYDLCYFLTVTISSTGYGDITPKSSRLKLIISLLIAFVFTMLFSFSLYGIKSTLTTNLYNDVL